MINNAYYKFYIRSFKKKNMIKFFAAKYYETHVDLAKDISNFGSENRAVCV